MTSKINLFTLGFWIELPQILGLGFSVQTRHTAGVERTRMRNHVGPPCRNPYLINGLGIVATNFLQRLL